jgi:ubiquinone/menaquinone biosynthesis C-methylase UbiE
VIGTIAPSISKNIDIDKKSSTMQSMLPSPPDPSQNSLPVSDAQERLSPDELAQKAKSLGDPLRLAVVQLLGKGSFGVLELCELLNTKQSGMSHHLKVLAQAGWVDRQREGNSIFYRRPLVTASDPLADWQRATFNALDQLSIGAQLKEQLERILALRAQACTEFFEKNAKAFKAQQDLIASYDQYGDTLEQLVNELKVPDNRALEVGSGDGTFLPALSHCFQQVTAVDISAPMLQQAQQRVASLQLANVECLLGETSTLNENWDGRYGLVCANMVLHHMPEPRSLFTEARRLLARRGALLITDLCHHDQAWVRESCGDLWLGFDPQLLSSWASEAGLTEGQSQYLGLRNGFQIQFRLFYRS